MYLNYQLIDDLVQPEIGAKISHRYTVRVSKWFLAKTDLPLANEVWGNVMFLDVSIILSTCVGVGGGWGVGGGSVSCYFLSGCLVPVTSCLAAWSHFHVPSGGSSSGQIPPWTEPPPPPNRGLP